MAQEVLAEQVAVALGGQTKYLALLAQQTLAAVVVVVAPVKALSAGRGALELSSFAMLVHSAGQAARLPLLGAIPITPSHLLGLT